MGHYTTVIYTAHLYRLTDVAFLEGLLEVAVVPVLLNGVRSDDAHEVVLVEEPPDRKVAERNAASSQTVKLERAAQQTVQLLTGCQTIRYRTAIVKNKPVRKETTSRCRLRKYESATSRHSLRVARHSVLPQKGLRWGDHVSCRLFDTVQIRQAAPPTTRHDSFGPTSQN